MAHQKKEAVIVDGVLARAQALRVDEIQQLYFDPMLAKKVCKEGLFYLEKRLEVLTGKYPGFELDELRDLPELCDRVSAAQREVDLVRGVRTIESPALVAVAGGWRRKLMPIAESLVENDKVDAKAVARIRSGRGQVDLVRDVLDLVVLLRPHDAAVTGTCGPNALELAKTAATDALESMGLGASDPEVTRLAAEVRDRYATLIVRGHDRLRSAVAAVSSFKVAQRVVGPLANRGTTSAPEAPEPAGSPST